MVVSTECILCGKEVKIKVNPLGLLALEEGKLIQEALSDLSPSEREVLISGICPHCQKKIFGE